MEVCLAQLPLGKPRFEMRTHGRPFLVSDAVPGAVAVLAVADEHVVSVDSLEGGTERFEGTARTLDLRVLLPLDAPAAPRIERVLQL